MTGHSTDAAAGHRGTAGWLGPALVAAGLALVALALAASGSNAGTSASFGWRQWLVLLAGVALVGAGVLRLRADGARTAAASLAGAARAHGGAVLGLALLGAFAYAPVFGTRPFDRDNLQMLARGATDSPLDLWTATVTPGLPDYRPLSYTSIWAQFQVSGVDADAYFVVNIALVVAVGLVAYALARVLGASRGPAGLGAAGLVVSGALVSSVFWIGARTLTLSCLLGALALVLALRRPDARWSPPALFGLLVAAALCKEYGLAFAAALLAIALLGDPARRARLAVAAIGAVVAYAVIRLVAIGASTGYCEQMGLFGESRAVCFGEEGEGELLTGGARLGQHAYNVGAGFVGTFAPWLFSADGSFASGAELPLGTTLVRALGTLLFTALAVLAWVRAPRIALPLLALAAGNAVLNLYVYRERDHIVGLLALAVAAAIGAGLAGRVLPRAARAGAAVLAAAVLAAWVVVNADARRDYLEAYKAEVNGYDPCPSPATVERLRLDPQVVADVRTANGLPPACAPGAPEQ